MRMNDKLIELPDYGRLIVVTDLHGDLDDYNHYLSLWDESDPDFHIVFTGDLIHGLDEETDGSVQMQWSNQRNIQIFILFWEIMNGHISQTRRFIRTISPFF